MQGVREVLRGSLGRSLRSLSEEDRLAAAWVLACGPALAERAEILALDEGGVLHVRVLRPEWRDQFGQMRTMLTDELRKIAGVRLQTIHFEGQRLTRDRTREATATGAKGPSRTAGVARRKEQPRGL